jgi:hypothetical protein
LWHCLTRWLTTLQLTDKLAAPLATCSALSLNACALARTNWPHVSALLQTSLAINTLSLRDNALSDASITTWLAPDDASNSLSDVLAADAPESDAVVTLTLPLQEPPEQVAIVPNTSFMLQRRGFNRALPPCPPRDPISDVPGGAAPTPSPFDAVARVDVQSGSEPTSPHAHAHDSSAVSFSRPLRRVLSSDGSNASPVAAPVVAAQCYQRESLFSRPLLRSSTLSTLMKTSPVAVDMDASAAPLAAVC